MLPTLFKKGCTQIKKRAIYKFVIKKPKAKSKTTAISSHTMHSLSAYVVTVSELFSCSPVQTAVKQSTNIKK